MAQKANSSEMVNAHGEKGKAQLHWEEWQNGDTLPGPIAVKDHS